MNEVLKIVKDQIFPTLGEMVVPDVTTQLGISREAYDEIIYSHIMALGFNKGDVNAALNDLMPYRNPAIYNDTEEEDALKMVNNLIMIMEDYKFQYWAFKVFWENIQNKMAIEDALIEVQKILFT